MKNKFFSRMTLPLCAFSLLLPLQSPRAEETGSAEALHSQHCVRCHDQSVYVRENRRIKSYAALSRQVKRCEIPAKVNWSEDEVQGVVDYLNTQYYKFDH